MFWTYNCIGDADCVEDIGVEVHDNGRKYGVQQDRSYDFQVNSTFNEPENQGPSKHSQRLLNTRQSFCAIYTNLRGLRRDDNRCGCVSRREWLRVKVFCLLRTGVGGSLKFSTMMCYLSQGYLERCWSFARRNAEGVEEVAVGRSGESRSSFCTLTCSEPAGALMPYPAYDSLQVRRYCFY